MLRKKKLFFLNRILDSIICVYYQAKNVWFRYFYIIDSYK
ncbi:hypothetical protein OENI_220005 [Oenococcus oeni]|nr:hypothetical protein OENI_220005 [Oenococcus oeni]